jgi:signal transduction histidine kinase
LRRVSLPGCIDKARVLVAEAAAKQGVRVEVRAQHALPEVFADPDQLLQVLLNVFRNALEAMPRGGTLTVDTRLVESAPFVRRSGGRRAEDRILPRGHSGTPRPVAQVRISDTGEGIRPEHLPRLFDPFFTTRATGTGLGLSICQSIVHEHGGSISAESSPGRGTTIIVELPLEKRHGQRRKDG